MIVRILSKEKVLHLNLEETSLGVSVVGTDENGTPLVYICQIQTDGCLFLFNGIDNGFCGLKTIDGVIEVKR